MKYESTDIEHVQKIQIVEGTLPSFQKILDSIQHSKNNPALLIH